MHRSITGGPAAPEPRTGPGRRALGAFTSMLVVAAMLPIALGTLAGTASASTTFCNSSGITINDRIVAQPPNAATPSPSTITVSGMSGIVSDVNLSLTNLTEPRTDDLDVLLEAPGGTNLMALSDSGGLNAVSNYNLTLDDSAATTLPDSTAWPASPTTSKPVDYDVTADEAFPAPAPSPSAATTLSTFNGLSANGTWDLWIVDDSLGGGAGSMGSWCLDIATSAAAATTTTLVSSQNASFTGDSVTFTSTTTDVNANPVTEGTVTFTVDGVTVGPPVAVGGSGQASLSTNALTEGSHTVQATYNGTTNFGTSNASLTQVVNNHTTVNGNDYCNTGPITINSSSEANQPATPYPSNVFTSGLAGTVTDVNVTLKGVSHDNPDDIDAMLVGPGGQNLIVLSDAGGSTPVSNFDVTFDDSAAAPLPDTGGWGTSPATAQPTNYTPADTFPSPAPAPSAATTLSTFNGQTPNGTWALYVVDDSLGTGGTIAGGWCMTLTTNGTPDMGVTTTHAPEPVEVNNLLTQTINVTDLGAGDASNVQISETLPSQMTFVSLDRTSGPAPSPACSTPAAGASGTVSCQWSTFASGATTVFALKLRPKATGPFSLQVTVTDTGDSNGTNDTASASGTVSPNGRGCTIVGTKGADTIDGTAGADVICGLAGDDHINGMGGNDTLYGQAGNDTITDTVGTDKLLGGPGNDSLNSQDGSGGDTLNGGRGTNSCTADAGDSRKNC